LPPSFVDGQRGGLLVPARVPTLLELMARRGRTALVGALCALGVVALPSGAWAAGSAYVGNYISDNGTQYDLGAGGLLALKTLPTFAPGNGPWGVAASPDGRSVYVTNSDGANLSQFDVGVGGVLTPKTPATVATGTNPYQVAVAPDGRSVYVVNNANNNVSQFDVGAGGVLTPKTPATVATGASPYEVAVAPDGQSVYVLNFGAASLSQYDVGAGGVLTPKTPATVATGASPFFMTFTPDGRSAYVANYGGATVSQYNVGAGGLLTAKTPATVATGTAPAGIEISPDGRSAYVNNSGNATVGQYDVGAGQLLTAKSPATVATGVSPGWMAIAPDGLSLYSVNFGSNTISQFDVGTGGLLAAKSVPTVATGANPRGIALLPNQGPVASFAATAGPAGSVTSFNASASSDPDGSVARYDWDFGDGAVAVNGGPILTHTYATPGARTVTLTVTDNAGCSTTFVYNGQTALCNGGQSARSTQTVTVPPAAFGAKTLVSLRLAAKKIPAKGPVAVRLSNGNNFQVTGRVAGRTANKITVAAKRRVSLKWKRFTIAAHGRKTVKLSLPKSLRRVLKRNHKIALVITVRVKDPAGHTRTVKKRVTPKLKRARRR
jgi:DNA-binding beta-propeller fold protein YncE